MSSFSETVYHWDRSVFRSVFRFKRKPLTSVMRGFTAAGTAGALWGAFAAAAFPLSGWRLRNLLLPWTGVALSWVAAEGSKYLFDRKRPFVADTDVLPLIKTPSSSSFPSGHSATAASGALVLSVIYPAFAPVLALSGLLVASSRVYLGVHYPSDVIAGALIGLATSGVLLLLSSAVAA